jgi:hypothetical protein
LARSRRQRNADAKLIIAATVAVLLAGFVIGAGLFVAANDGDRTSCGRYPIGPADSLREDLERSPSFQTGGAACAFWLALDEGDIVAYKVDQPGDCELNISREQFVCDDEAVDTATLDQYPVSIETIDDIDTVVVDLNPRTEDSTSTPSTFPTT